MNHYNNIDPTTVKGLARAISLVEAGVGGTNSFLSNWVAKQPKVAPIVGVTGPPGAGKSTLINALIHNWVAQGKRIAIIAIDPSSPFNFGALLGDRIRMVEHFTNHQVFIRSLATRGALGGLSAKSIEISDLIRRAGFDIVLVETVGVGQSEVEIAGLADLSIVVLVPEAGDDIQGMKAGIMEIADLFIVNKADRPGAEQFASRLRKLLHGGNGLNEDTQVLLTTATDSNSITMVAAEVLNQLSVVSKNNEKQAQLYLMKCLKLLSEQRMQSISKLDLYTEIKDRLLTKSSVNIYEMIAKYAL
ncbi:MAG: GTP-binding protein [Bacteroidota bacterium]|nr:GTP-binding protein [Bacteroidota bacterium]